MLYAKSTGTLEAPIPTSRLDKQTFYVLSSTGDDAGTPYPLLVTDWVKGIEAGDSPDGLTKLDRHIDGSIGNLATALENIPGTQKPCLYSNFANLLELKRTICTAALAWLKPHPLNITTGIKLTIPLWFHDKYPNQIIVTMDFPSERLA